MDHAPRSGAVLAGGRLARFWLCYPHYAFLSWTLGASVLMMLPGIIFLLGTQRPDADGLAALPGAVGSPAAPPRASAARSGTTRWPGARRPHPPRPGAQSLMRWVFLIGGLAAGRDADGRLRHGACWTWTSARSLTAVAVGGAVAGAAGAVQRLGQRHHPRARGRHAGPAAGHADHQSLLHLGQAARADQLRRDAAGGARRHGADVRGVRPVPAGPGRGDLRAAAPAATAGPTATGPCERCRCR